MLDYLPRCEQSAPAGGRRGQWRGGLKPGSAWEEEQRPEALSVAVAPDRKVGSPHSGHSPGHPRRYEGNGSPGGSGILGNPPRGMNSYVLKGDDGYVLVDCGWEAPCVLDALRAGLRDLGIGLDVLDGRALTAGSVVRTLPWARRGRRLEELHGEHLRLAVSETLSYLERLRANGQLVRGEAGSRLVYTRSWGRDA